MRNITFFFIGITFLLVSIGCQNGASKTQDNHLEVVMRKIGHEILLNSNDSTSRVLPIVNNGNEHRIQFESNFSFQPDTLINTIDTIIKSTLPIEHYIVQVEKCETSEIMYSYEMGNVSPFDIVACKGRSQPLNCYEVVIVFIEDEQETSNTSIFILIAGLLLLGGVYWIKKKKPPVNDHHIHLGKYRYNPNKMILMNGDKTIELTSKESELLNLLYNSVNETIDREVILNKVWGDEGDYVGRTLDVYISKLRKKLGPDTAIEIKNIRGIGYKLILEN